MSLETLQNLSNVSQHVFVSGVRHEIPPHEARTFEDEVVQEFLAQRTRYVRRFEGRKDYTVLGDKPVWIANATGNPFVSEKIKRVVIRKGEETEVIQDNPLRKPKAVSEKIRGGQTYAQVDSMMGLEETNLNQPARVYEIMPFERVPFGSDVAERFLTRDGFREEEHQGQVIQCPAAYPFEPNDSWALDDVRLFAMMLDSVDLHCDPARDGTPPERAFTGKKKDMGDAKSELLRKIFFRLIDHRYSPPTQEEFIAAKEDVVVHKDEVAKAVAETKSVVEQGIAQADTAQRSSRGKRK